jgi:beta-galactosidase
LEKMPALIRPKAPVAIVFDYEDLWVLRLDPHHRAFSYYGVALDIYRQLWESNIPVDFVPRSADLTGYQAVFVPCPALIDEQHAAGWRRYVEGGGKLVVTFRAFFKNPGNTWSDQPTPAGGLGELLGVQVEEFVSIPSVAAVGMRGPGETAPDWDDDRGSTVHDVTPRPSAGFGEGFGLPPKVRYHTWAEVLKPTSASVLMRYGDGYYRDGVAVTVNKVGSGEAYMLGCWTDPILPRNVWQALDLQKLAAKETDTRSTVIEIIRLQDEAGTPVEIRLNHTKRTVSLPVSLPGGVS